MLAMVQYNHVSNSPI